MPQLDAPVFKLGQWSVVRFGAVTSQFSIFDWVSAVFQQWLSAQHFQNLLGILLPVGRAVDVAAHFQPRRQLGDQRLLDQPAFVVPFFVPRVGEKDVYAVQTL